MNLTSNLRVLSLLPVVGHPRDSKRIDMLLAAGMSVQAAAFSRDHPVSRPPRCDVKHLGRVEDGRYLRRIVSALSALGMVIRLGRRCDIVYASGQDMALIGLCASLVTRKPVVMEVGDLREAQLARGAMGWIVRSIDRYIARHVAFIVVTSELFISRYYKPLVRHDVNHIVIENKLDGDFVRSVESGLQGAHRPAVAPDASITIGYFGVLRFQWPLDALFALLSRNPDRFRLLLAGYSAGNVDLTKLLSLKSQVQYISNFRSPDDLPSLYGQIDLAWCAYPVAGNGHSGKQWVRANRFYEACLFKKPLVVLGGTGDADAVQARGIGLVLPDADIEDVTRRVECIAADKLAAWARAIRALPRSMYAYEAEYRLLAQKMDAAVRYRSQ